MTEHNVFCVSGARLKIAPADPRAIVRAHARRLCEFWLDFLPIQPTVAETTFEQHRGRTRPCAIKVHWGAVHFVELSWNGVTTQQTPKTEGVIQGARQHR